MWTCLCVCVCVWYIRKRTASARELTTTNANRCVVTIIKKKTSAHWCASALQFILEARRTRNARAPVLNHRTINNLFGLYHKNVRASLSLYVLWLACVHLYKCECDCIIWIQQKKKAYEIFASFTIFPAQSHDDDDDDRCMPTTNAARTHLIKR